MRTPTPKVKLPTILDSYDEDHEVFVLESKHGDRIIRDMAIREPELDDDWFLYHNEFIDNFIIHEEI